MNNIHHENLPKGVQVTEIFIPSCSRNSSFPIRNPVSEMPEDEDIDENSSLTYDDKNSLLKQKKRFFFFKKAPKKSQKQRPDTKHNTNKWHVNDINAERKTGAKVTNKPKEQNIDTNLTVTDDLEDSTSTRCCCFGRMFGCLKRKLFRSGTSTTKSKRARLKNEKIESNVASSSSQQSNQNNSNTGGVDEGAKYNHFSPKLVTCETNEILDIKPVEKRKKKNRRRTKNQSLNGTENNTSEMPEEIRNDPKLKKYWINRYRLFSRYDDGIKLDAESWYSVTPEKIGEEIARRCQCDVIIDAFCGAGGNTIQFAFVCERVIAIDIDAEKIKLAKHNAEIYGVADRIEFIVGDFFLVGPTLTADVVFLSPPWGGPSYKAVQDFPMSQIMEPYGGKLLYDVAKLISDHIAYFLPRNMNLSEIAALEPKEYVKIDKNYLDNRVVAITAYFGDLVEDYGDEWNN